MYNDKKMVNKDENVMLKVVHLRIIHLSQILKNVSSFNFLLSISVY